MTTELKSPTPRRHPRTCPRFDYGFTEAIFLPLAKPLRITFDRVLARRRSSRNFDGPLSPARLGPLLGLAARKRDRSLPLGRIDWQSRPYPSAGGCHEIDLLVLHVAGHEDAAFIYDAEHHALGVLPNAGRRNVRALLREINDVVPVANATVIWFVADVRRLAVRYRYWESLLWRDSGSLGATLSLVAGALGHAACVLGPHAPASLKGMFRREDFLVGAGGCVVGGSAPSGMGRGAAF
jgi:SagB-type dehydrogenase family enzyme